MNSENGVLFPWIVRYQSRLVIRLAREHTKHRDSIGIGATQTHEIPTSSNEVGSQATDSGAVPSKLQLWQWTAHVMPCMSFPTFAPKLKSMDVTFLKDVHPRIIHLNRSFPDENHPILGTPISGNPQVWSLVPMIGVPLLCWGGGIIHSLHLLWENPGLSAAMRLDRGPTPSTGYFVCGIHGQKTDGSFPSLNHLNPVGLA